MPGFRVRFDLRYKICEIGNQSSEELIASFYNVYKFVSRFMFKHPSRNVSVLFGKNIDHGPLKEQVNQCKLRI